jgi:cytochrome c
MHHRILSGRNGLTLLLLLFAGLLLLSTDSLADPIHDAAKNGDVVAVEEALDSGVDPNKSNGLATPLYYAVTKEHVEAVKLLISRGADVNLETTWGPPIVNAAWKCNIEILQLLLTHGANSRSAFKTDTALHMAAERGHLACVKLLVDSGADINALNKFREPPIHLAKKNGHENVVQYFVEQGYVAPRPLPIAASLLKANPKNGENIFKVECMRCHDSSVDQRSFRGPPLWNIIGRRVASIKGFPYSPVLKARGGNWDYESLNLFISDPSRTMPGTDMGSNGLQDATLRADLIAFLRSRSDTPPSLPSE